jgi:hypothetical protein
MLGGALGGPGPNSAIDNMARQNQQIMSQQPQGAAPTAPGASDQQATSAAGVDSYEAKAQALDSKAGQFEQVGNMQAATQLRAAAQQFRQQGIAAQRNMALTRQEQARAGVEEGKAQESKAGASYIAVDSSPDKFGIPQYKRYGTAVSLYNADGSLNPQFQDQYKAALADAQKNGAQAPTMLRPDQLENSKAQAAAIRAQASIATAQARASATSAQATDLSDEDLRTAAVVTLADPNRMHDYATYGKFGQSRRDAITHAQGEIMKEAGISANELAGLRASIKGEASSVNKVIPQLNNINAFDQLARANGQRLLDLVGSVDTTGVPALEGYIRAIKARGGSPDTNEFNSVLNSFQTEAARILNNPGLTGVLSDHARQDMQKVVDGSLDGPSLRRVINRVFTEIDIRRTSLEQAVQGAKTSMQIPGLGGGTPQNPPPAGAGWSITPAS